MITARLATIPQRIELVKKTIESLLPQVDLIDVMCNNYSERQAADLDMHFDSDKLWTFVRHNEMTDGEKYYGIENAEPGYIFICDDDIKYPPNYVEYMISKIEHYKRKYVVSLHGRQWDALPIKSFFGTSSRRAAYSCLKEVEGDHVVMNEKKIGMVGDGVSAWHTDTLKMRYEYVKEPNMAQLWLGLTCNRFNVPQMVVEHPADFLEYLWPEDLNTHETLWEQEHAEAYLQTELINKTWIKR